MKLSKLAPTCAFALAIAGAASAQDHAPGYSAPKTGWGVPDLQGTWSNASVTDMQREPGFPNLVLSPEEAARMEGSDDYNISTREERGAIYEYACQEGNYGMANILSGARADEAKAAGQE